MSEFWRRNRYYIMMVGIVLVGILLFVFVGIPYMNECLDRGGIMFGGKDNSICWTQDGILWPWDIWN